MHGGTQSSLLHQGLLFLRGASYIVAEEDLIDLDACQVCPPLCHVLSWFQVAATSWVYFAYFGACFFFYF